jgi:hypothetical protein
MFNDWFIDGGFSYTDPTNGFDAALWSSRDWTTWGRAARNEAFSGELQGTEGQGIRSMVTLESRTVRRSCSRSGSQG